MTENHEVVEPALVAHGAESQQGSQGFACPWACKHQQVAAAALELELEPAPQQLDQLLLPLPWLNLPGLDRGAPLRGVVLCREVEADG